MKKISILILNVMLASACQKENAESTATDL